MKSNAPGQLVGYILQLQRALVYLLNARPGDSVCVEVIGDVGLLSENTAISEEDKSSIQANPVTNRSTDLWKTFSNWIDAINNGDIVLEKTKFIIYSNHAGQKGIINWLSDANSPPLAEECLKKIKTLLKDIQEEHDIFPFLQKVYKNQKLMLEIILRFEFILGNNSNRGEVKEELDRIYIPKEYHDTMHDELLGWVTNHIQSKILNKKLALISQEEFKQHNAILIQRIRSKNLIDFTVNTLDKDLGIEEQLELYPYYLQQLKVINAFGLIRLNALKSHINQRIQKSVGFLYITTAWHVKKGF
jgi:hypothetical protein